MRILIYGAGVIGCLYGALFAEAGHDVCVLARGERLNSLERDGLRYRTGQTVKAARVTILSRLDAGDLYEFVFLTVREDQVKAALEELKDNVSPAIVTMVNSLGGYAEWERICGAGRILPAFPGAGGGWENGVLDAALTPRFIQRTTLGEIDGGKTQRLDKLAMLFKSAGIPYQIVPDMQRWQLCHLAMVVPIADAYYAAEDPRLAGKDFSLMRQTSGLLFCGFISLYRMVRHTCGRPWRLLTLCGAAGVAGVLLAHVQIGVLPPLLYKAMVRQGLSDEVFTLVHEGISAYLLPASVCIILLFYTQLAVMLYGILSGRFDLRRRVLLYLLGITLAATAILALTLFLFGIRGGAGGGESLFEGMMYLIPFWYWKTERRVCSETASLKGAKGGQIYAKRAIQHGERPVQASRRQQDAGQAGGRL